jgi:hypothetical protein
MPKAQNILIHNFSISSIPYFDDDGDQMFGYYYQFADENDNALTGLIGPYLHSHEAEQAALQAYQRRDF